MATGIVNFVHQGGAISRVKRESTAFWHRDANHSVMMIGFWDDPALAAGCMQWVKTGLKGVAAAHERFLRERDRARRSSPNKVRATYGDNYDRLVALKKHYDPTNLFRLNANVAPQA